VSVRGLGDALPRANCEPSRPISVVRRMGDLMMTRILDDVLLFCCVAAFVAGTVIVAGTLLSYAG
jgi:hypothetical protein